MGKADATQRYQGLVWAFRHVTGSVGANGRCCEKTRDGAPECCYRVADGTDDLTFTMREAAILYDLGVEEEWFTVRDGLLVLDRQTVTETEILNATHNGWLANTLECASHPTRPVVVGRTVVAVVVIDGCNAQQAMVQYTRARDSLRALWQDALDLVGPKPYYASYSIRPGWTVL